MTNVFDPPGFEPVKEPGLAELTRQLEAILDADNLWTPAINWIDVGRRPHISIIGQPLPEPTTDDGFSVVIMRRIRNGTVENAMIRIGRGRGQKPEQPDANPDGSEQPPRQPLSTPTTLICPDCGHVFP